MAKTDSKLRKSNRGFDEKNEHDVEKPEVRVRKESQGRVSTATTMIRTTMTERTMIGMTMIGTRMIETTMIRTARK